MSEWHRANRDGEFLERVNLLPPHTLTRKTPPNYGHLGNSNTNNVTRATSNTISSLSVILGRPNYHNNF